MTTRTSNYRAKRMIIKYVVYGWTGMDDAQLQLVYRTVVVAIFIRLAVVASQICQITRNKNRPILTYSSSRSSKVIDLDAIAWA